MYKCATFLLFIWAGDFVLFAQRNSLEILYMFRLFIGFLWPWAFGGTGELDEHYVTDSIS